MVPGDIGPLTWRYVVLIDMHVSALDSNNVAVDPRTVLDLAVAAGLDAILVVGPPGMWEPAAWLEAQVEDDPFVFVAFGVRSARGLFYCVPRDPEVQIVPARWATRSEEQPLGDAEVLAWMKTQGAAVIASQPYDRRFGPAAADLVFAFDGIHAVEVRFLGVDALSADMALEAGMGMRLPCLAGSGVLDDPPFLGRFATLFPAVIEDQAGLVDALKAGEAWPVTIERPNQKPEKKKRRRRRKRRKPSGAPTAS